MVSKLCLNSFSPIGSFVQTSTSGSTSAANCVNSCIVGAAPIAGVCQIVPAGYSSSDGLTSTICPAGSFSPSSGSTSCQPCSLTTFSSSPGAASCSVCAVGTYSASTGGVACNLLSRKCLLPSPNSTANELISYTSATAVCLNPAYPIFSISTGSAVKAFCSFYLGIRPTTSTSKPTPTIYRYVSPSVYYRALGADEPILRPTTVATLIRGVLSYTTTLP
jgi:hypothetical protein